MTSGSGESYRVLARKYRPESFADLVGQEAMVRTLTNAFAMNRIAQAFIMTGIRGTGKTTTARIIAKGMNCIGPDGSGGPTVEPCGICENCVAISEGRHVDVLEMDAASRTGVGDIREIIESVAYRAASARYKIYIIDEVHMLSNSAFNALLKTLEEPPEHVKFIFATTEIHKVPVTVLSRCQRFDLRRIESEDMMALLKRISEAEGAVISEEGLGLILRAAEGSARDATSLLDQAISHGATANSEIGAAEIRALLGLSDRGRVLELFALIVGGKIRESLEELASLYADGADPSAIMAELAELAHWLSILKIAPDLADDPSLSSNVRARGAELASKIEISVLTRLWQMLLKALEELKLAPNSMMAAEMAIIRLAHIADLPPPEKLIRQIQAQPSQGSGEARSTDAGEHPIMGGSNRDKPVQGSRSFQPGAALAPSMKQESLLPASFPSAVELLRAEGDLLLVMDIEQAVKLVSYRPGRIEFELKGNAAADLPARIRAGLERASGARWGVSVVSEGGGATLAEQYLQDLEAKKAELIKAHPLVSAAFEHFPDAKLLLAKDTAPAREDKPQLRADEASDDWNALEED